MLFCSSPYHCLVRQTGKVGSVISFMLKRKKLRHQKVTFPKGQRDPELDLEPSFPDPNPVSVHQSFIELLLWARYSAKYGPAQINPKIYRFFSCFLSVWNFERGTHKIRAAGDLSVRGLQKERKEPSYIE